MFVDDDGKLQMAMIQILWLYTHNDLRDDSHSPFYANKELVISLNKVLQNYLKDQISETPIKTPELLKKEFNELIKSNASQKKSMSSIATKVLENQLILLQELTLEYTNYLNKVTPNNKEQLYDEIVDYFYATQMEEKVKFDSKQKNITSELYLAFSSNPSAISLCLKLGEVFIKSKYISTHDNRRSCDLEGSGATINASPLISNEEEGSITKSKSDQLFIEHYFEKFKIKSAKETVRNKKNVGFIICAANCVYSAPREIADNDPTNLILIKLKENSFLTLEGSFIQVIKSINSQYGFLVYLYTKIHNELHANYSAILTGEKVPKSLHEQVFKMTIHHESEIDSFLKTHDPELRYIQFMLDWCDGNVHFSECSPRYSGIKYKVDPSNKDHNEKLQHLLLKLDQKKDKTSAEDSELENVKHLLKIRDFSYSNFLAKGILITSGVFVLIALIPNLLTSLIRKK